METENTNINKFSWQRVYHYGMLYKSNIQNQLLVVTIILVLAYLCLLPCREFESEGAFAYYSLIAVLVSYCTFSGALIFSRRDDSLMTQVPAKISEKTAFLLGYSLVVVPLFVIIVWYLFNFIGGLFIENGNIESAIKKMVRIKYDINITTQMTVATYINSICQTAAMILSVLFVVIKSIKNRFIKGLLTPLILLLVLGIIGGIYGVVAAISGMELGFDTDDPNGFANLIVGKVTTMGYIVDIIFVAYCVFIGYSIYRHNKTHQVA